MKLAILVFALTALVLLIIWKPSARLEVTNSSDAIRKVRNGVQAAEDQIPRVGGGLANIELFAENLKAIDASGAPEDLRIALSNYTAAVEKHGEELRQSGFNSVTADKVGEAQKEFRRVLVKQRGEF